MKKNMKLNRSLWKTLFVGITAGLFYFAICISGVLYAQDTYLADALYQHPTVQSDDIVLINLDQKSLDALGPFGSWGRALMGDVINILNEDTSSAPAVIALDILYVGESDDPEGDAYLAEACGNSCPVVTACAGTFGTQLVEEEDGSFYMDDYSLTAFDEPYEALKAATWQGHINSMFDSDGILRHGIWQIDLPDGETVPSFHRQIYERYCEQIGKDASTIPVTDEDYRYYIPFQGKPGAFSDGYGVIDLLNGEIDPSVYAGKIVLIGPYAAGMQDDFATAIDHAGKMYGIEYQANMIQALLNGQTKREVKQNVQAFLVFLVSVLWTFLFYHRRLSVSIMGWIGTVLGYVGICWLLYGNGIVLSPLYIVLAVTVLFVCSIVSSYLRAALEKRKVTATFERYVAPEIVQELLKEGTDATALGGKLYDIAVLFVDIRGFTTMSEILEPTEVVQILNRYLELTSTCIFKNNGTLDKFVGDCTMAFWGAPLPQEDSIYKAVKTAFDMIEQSKALEKELEERCGRTVSFGVGVHFGPAVVGNIGATNRMDYTAIGDTVNTAARLEANAPGGCVYVSRVVADALEGRVRFTSLGDSVPLKGKAAGFEVLRVEELLNEKE